MTMMRIPFYNWPCAFVAFVALVYLATIGHYEGLIFLAVGVIWNLVERSLKEKG